MPRGSKQDKYIKALERKGMTEGQAIATGKSKGVLKQSGKHIAYAKKKSKT